MPLALFASACAGSDAPDTAAPSSVNEDDQEDGQEDAQPGETQPEETQPEETQPEETQPEETPSNVTPVPAAIDPASVPRGEAVDFGPPPAVPTGPLAPETAAEIETLLGDRLVQRIIDADTFGAITLLGQSEDPRVAWLLADLMRIANGSDLTADLISAQANLLGIDVDPLRSWNDIVNHLIAWDIPAPPDYLQFKRNTLLLIEPRWEPLLVESADIDWRIVSWGGVAIDDRPYDTTDIPCNCIPAVDNPTTTDVAGGDEWLDDDTIIFGVEINGETRAYPRSIMEVREMVNDTLGGRDFAMPYCTLCGSAQVYFTDEVPDGIERPILRTSGMLSRSNKVMYDVTTFSIFDTFLGKAVTGPLAEAGIEFNQHSVITTTWGQWKTEYPDTTVLDIALANGRPQSDLRNTRDADGPIFPIGDVDPRLPVQEDVLGLLTADGTPIAFHVNSAIAALDRGEFIEVDGITLELDGGGVRAFDADGNDLGGHQAFWFAWSQFYPDTELWPTT